MTTTDDGHRASSRITLNSGESVDIFVEDNGMVALTLPTKLVLHLTSEESQTVAAFLNYCSALASTTRRRHLRAVRNGDEADDQEGDE